VVLGRIKLPSAAEMAKDSAAWVAREEKLKGPSEQIDFQTDYVKDLMKDTDYPKFDLDHAAEMFKEWEHHKVESILGYRDKAFPSPCTGTMGTLHHTVWIKAMDDSMKSFLGKA
jgi:trimethylamine monooxygenase